MSRTILKIPLNTTLSSQMTLALKRLCLTFCARSLSSCSFINSILQQGNCVRTRKMPFWELITQKENVYKVPIMATCCYSFPFGRDVFCNFSGAVFILLSCTLICFFRLLRGLNSLASCLFQLFYVRSCSIYIKFVILWSLCSWL